MWQGPTVTAEQVGYSYTHRTYDSGAGVLMTLKDLLEILWRRRLLLLGATAAAIVLAVAITVGRPTTYSAHSQLLLNQPQTFGPGGDALATAEKLDLLGTTYAKLVAAPQFVSDSLRRANVGLGDATVAGDSPVNTGIVAITVRSGSSARATSVASAVQEGLRQKLDALQPAAPDGQRLTATVIEQPTAKVSSSNGAFAVFAAVIVALVIAGTAAVLLESP